MAYIILILSGSEPKTINITGPIVVLIMTIQVL